jgi:RecG-like helicase
MGSNAQMNRLLQGCRFRKNNCGLYMLLLALDNGFQACLMAQKEANQHFIGLSELANEH